MSYIERLNSEEVQILMDHPNGLKCWLTDYKILKEDKEEQALLNFNEDKHFREAYDSDENNVADEPVEQQPLFPNN